MATGKRAVEARLVRAVVERLLRDDFSPQDCWIAATLFEDRKFCNRLATAVQAIAEEEEPRRPPSQRGRASGIEARPSGVGEFFDLYKRRKITKEQLRNILESVSDSKLNIHPDNTARDMIMAFVALADKDELRRLWGVLSPSGGTDPYLKGILGR